MISDPPASAPEPAAAAKPATEPGPASWRVIAAGIAILLCAAAWFVIAAFVMKESVLDALGEALGVALGFLVAFSVLGAVLAARAKPGD